MERQSEIDFLKDQVSRLNGKLSYYQELYLDKADKNGSNQLKMVFNNHTTPLLAEYDKTIHELTQELQRHKEELNNEQRRVKAIVIENERLWEQAKGGSVYSTNKSGSDSALVDNLKQQNEAMKREINGLEDVQRLSTNEIERLQQLLEERQSKPEAQIFSQQIDSMRNQYRSSMAELEDQIVAFKDRIRDQTNEVEQLRSENLELDRQLKLLQEKMEFEKQATEENLSQLKTSMRRIEFLEEEKKQLILQANQYKSNIKNQDGNMDEWNSVIRNLESRCRDKDMQLFELNEQISQIHHQLDGHESIKKELELRELQATNECERLRGVISGILDDAGVRTREEVEAIRDGYDKEVERMLDELNFCEQNRQELIAEVDQLKRSKSQLESEMERFHKAEKDRDVQDNSSVDLYHDRAVRAEREREKLRLDLDAALLNLQKIRNDNNSKQELYEVEISQLRNKLGQLQSTCDKAQSDAERFSKLLLASEEGAANSRKKHQQQLKALRHEYEIFKQTAVIRQQELEHRLQSSEDIQKRYQDEMRQILTKQQQVGTKWREEAHMIAEQYENRISQLTKEMDRIKKRNEEMQELLHESRQKLLEAQETIEDKTKTMENLEDRLRIVDGDSTYKFEKLSKDDSTWKLQQLKKQQQKLVKETVARKYNFS